jgi:hypothetical protein
MSQETNSVNPADLHLPRDYKDDLDYRQPKPVINSTDTSDDEDKFKSGETTPINDTTIQTPKPPNPFTLLNKLVDMANQGTGGNKQRTILVPRILLCNLKKWSCNDGNILDVGPEKIAQSIKRSHHYDVSGRLSITNRLKLVLSRFYALRCEHEPHVRDLLVAENTFVQIHFQVVLMQPFKNFFKHL